MTGLRSLVVTWECWAQEREQTNKQTGLRGDFIDKPVFFVPDRVCWTSIIGGVNTMS